MNELLITFPDAETRREFLSKVDHHLHDGYGYGDDWKHLSENVDRIFCELPDQERTLKDRNCRTTLTLIEAESWLHNMLPPGKTFEEHFWGWKDGKPPVKAKGGQN